MRENLGTQIRDGFFIRPVDQVAQDLIGCHIHTIIGGVDTGGLITETEAYDQNDAASHCYIANGRIVPPKSSRPMTFAGGHLYFYYTQFGRCLNITADSEGFGSAVLVRCIIPSEGQDTMRERRRLYPNYRRALDDDDKFKSYLCNGPQNICESLGICDGIHAKSLERLSVLSPPFGLFARSESWNADIYAEKRIGIEQQLKRKKYEPAISQEAIDRKWRWKI